MIVITLKRNKKRFVIRIFPKFREQGFNLKLDNKLMCLYYFCYLLKFIHQIKAYLSFTFIKKTYY